MTKEGTTFQERYSPEEAGRSEGEMGNAPGSGRFLKNLIEKGGKTRKNGQQTSTTIHPGRERASGPSFHDGSRNFISKKEGKKRDLQELTTEAAVGVTRKTERGEQIVRGFSWEGERASFFTEMRNRRSNES